MYGLHRVVQAVHAVINGSETHRWDELGHADGYPYACNSLSITCEGCFLMDNTAMEPSTLVKD